MQRVCFVSFEIVPFTGGGIGTWLGNTLNAFQSPDTHCHVLFYGRQAISQVEFATAYPNATLHVLDVTAPGDDVLLPGQPAEPTPFESSKTWVSYALMRKLEQLERDLGGFDIIEFVDWGGPGFFTIQQKKLGRSFANTDVVVRLHGTETILRQFETRPWGYENLTLADIEHQAISQADYCVSHIKTNIIAYQETYGLPDTWATRCIVELPPIKANTDAIDTITPTSSTNLCFSSKFQGVKRPILFLAGAVEFMSASAEYTGSAIFAAFISDQAQVHQIHQIIPEHLSDRVTLATSASNEARDKVIRSSVVIFPNAFETFCFAAYEASMAGGVVVLNEKNSAFGPDTPWIDGVNCLKFDGTVAGLVALLARIFEPGNWATLGAKLAPIKYHHEPVPYWLQKRGRQIPAPAISHAPAPVSIVIPNRHGPDELLLQLQDIAAVEDRPYEIIVVDRGSDDYASRHVLDLLETSDTDNGPHSVRVLRRTTASNYAALANAGIAAAQHDIVAILPKRQRDTSSFIGAAADAIAAGGADIVLPTLRILKHYDDLDVLKFWIPLGGALRTNLFVNRFGFGAFIARRDLLIRQPFDEALPGEWSWDVLLRLAYSGSNVVVDIDRGPSVTESDLWHWSSAKEHERQRLIEGVRRNAWRMRDRLDFPWTSLGDGELTSSEWSIAPQAQVELQNARNHIAWLESERRHLIQDVPESASSGDGTLARLQAEHRAAVEAYQALANARTVRLALRLGNTVKRVLGRGR